MNRRSHRSSSRVRIGVVGTGLLIAAGFVGALVLPARAEGPDPLAEAWSALAASQSYDFSGEVEQVTTPVASITNVGRSSSFEQFHLEGSSDLVNDAVEFGVWAGANVPGASDPDVEVKVEDGVSYRRSSGGEWVESPGEAGVFAPGGDALAYLGAATGVVDLGEEVRAGRSIRRYGFTLDGSVLAVSLAEQHEALLRARGDLPLGGHVQPSVYHRDTTGTGELWVDQRGVPVRQVLSLRFPEVDGEVVSAEVTMDFSRLVAAPAGPWWSVDVSMVVWWLVLFGGVAGLTAALAVAAASRRLPVRAVAATLAVSFLAGLTVPSSESADAARLPGAGSAPGASPVVDAGDALRSMSQLTADPHVNLRAALAAPMVGGLSDDGADTDGDGLTDFVEARIGTDLDSADTDGDGVSDLVEVDGFEHPAGSGVWWYGDPFDVDSNADSVSDSVEWDLDLDGVPGDLDADGIPDVFDDDNDGDGVPDRRDLSPFTTLSATFGEDAPFSLGFEGLNDFGADRSTFREESPLAVDFQIRPTSPDHLQLALNRLDWPSDQLGQIRDVNNSDEDLRLYPMLEIHMPDGSAVLPSAEELASYQVSLSGTDPETGAVTAYVPLQLVDDSTTGARVAFSGRMPYRSQDTWGGAHQVRLVWAVQVDNDVPCDPTAVDAPPECAPDGYVYDVPQLVHRYYDDWTLTGLQVTQSHGADVALLYEEPTAESSDFRADFGPTWALSAVLQERFLTKRAPGEYDPDYLWGEGEVTSANIASLFDGTVYNGSAASVGEVAYGLPNIFRATTIQTESFDAAIAEVATTAMPAVLDRYASQWSGPDSIRPLVISASTSSARSAGLDDLVGAGATAVVEGGHLTFDFSPPAGVVPIVSSLSLRWENYCGGAGSVALWAPCSLEQIWTDIRDDRGDFIVTGYDPDNSGFQNLDLADPATDPDEAAYQEMSMVLYSMAMSGGLAATLGFGDGTEWFEARLASAVYDSEIVAATNTAETVLSSGFKGLGKYAANKAVAKTMLDKATVPSTRRLLTDLKALKESASIKGILATGFKSPRTRSPLAAGILLAAAAVATVIYFAAAGDETAVVALQVVAALAPAVGAAKTVYHVYKAWQFLAPKFKQVGLTFMNLKTAGLGYSAKAGVIGVALAVGVSVGFFLHSVFANGIKAFSPEFNALAVNAVAESIVGVLYVVLAATGIGLIIAGIVAVIDAIFTLICDVGGVDELETGFNGGCFTLAGSVSALITMALYSYDVMVDVDAPDFISIGAPDIELSDPDSGYIASNGIEVSLPVTTNVRHKPPADTNWLIAPYLWFYSASNLRTSAVVYSVTSGGTENLSTTRETMSGAWTEPTVWRTFNSKSLFAASKTDTPDVSVPFDTAGVNRELSFSLNFAYAVPAAECWGIPNIFLFPPTIPICYVETVQQSTSTALAPVLYDVLPDTVGEFAELGVRPDGGYGLAWDDSFPSIPDADGDGLLASWAGGLDPDDTTWDTDGDGLSDAYELERQAEGVAVSPNFWDTDADGLTDPQELRFGTDPANDDTDNDGLSDGEEVRHMSYSSATTWDGTWAGGWYVTVSTDIAGVPGEWIVTENSSDRVVAVSSDPLSADSDNDGLWDDAERQLAASPLLRDRLDVAGAPYHPLVFNAPPLDVEFDADTVRGGWVRPGQEFTLTTNVFANTSIGWGVLNFDVPELLALQTNPWWCDTIRVCELRNSIDPASVLLPFTPDTYPEVVVDSTVYDVVVDPSAPTGDLFVGVDLLARLESFVGDPWVWTVNEETPVPSNADNLYPQMLNTSVVPRFDSDPTGYVIAAREGKSTGADSRLISMPSSAGSPVKLDDDTEGVPRSGRYENSVDVACTPSGVCMTVWEDYANTDVHGSIVGADNAVVKSDWVLGSAPNTDVKHPQVVVETAPDGTENFLVAWASRVSSLSTSCCWDLKARRYTLDGTAIGDEYQFTHLSEYDSSSRRQISGFELLFFPEWDTAPSYASAVVSRARYDNPAFGSEVFFVSDGSLVSPSVHRTVNGRYDPAGLVGFDGRNSSLIAYSNDGPAYDARFDLVWRSGFLSASHVVSNAQLGGSGSGSPAKVTAVAHNPITGGWLATAQAAPNSTDSWADTALVIEPSFGELYNFPNDFIVDPAGAQPLGSLSETWDPSSTSPSTNASVACPAESALPYQFLFEERPGSTTFAERSFRESAQSFGEPAPEAGVPGAPGAPNSDFGVRFDWTDWTYPDYLHNLGFAETSMTATFWYRMERTEDANLLRYVSDGRDWTYPSYSRPFEIGSLAIFETSDGRIAWQQGGSVVDGVWIPNYLFDVRVPELADGEWHSVALTRSGSNGELTLLIDGVEKATAATSDLSTGGWWNARAGSGVSDIDHFQIYESVLSAERIDGVLSGSGADPSCVSTIVPSRHSDPDVRPVIAVQRHTFSVNELRGGRVDRNSGFTVRVDATAPEASVASMPLVAGSSASIVTVIGGSSSDVGSGVAGVEVRVDGGEWVAADGAEAWSFPLVVTNGFYEVEVRATDLVGNVGPISDPVIIEVDGVGPELIVELPVGPTGLDRDEDTGRLLFGLDGYVEDVGSGLAFDTVVQVQVVPAGSAVSPDGWQAAVYSPWSYFRGTWSMTYGFDADITELFGDFDVWVSVADVVGNESIVDVGTVDIDAAGPVVAAGDIPNIVTGSAILTGQVSDVGTAGTASVEVTLRTFDDVVAGVTPGNGWLAADVDAVSGDWTVAVPAGLEDLYQLDLRATDTVGNVTVETDVWRGIVDNRAPRLVATVVLTDPGDLRGTRLEYAAQCVAEDRFLEASSFDCAGSPYDEAERTFGADEDLEALFPGLVSVLRLESRFNTWVLRSSTPSARLRACDLFGNCSDSADVTPSAMVSSAWSRTAGRVRTSLATVAELSTVAGVPTVVVVTSPAEGAQVAGVVRVAFEATSANDLDRIEILIDDVVVATTDLTGSTETQYEASLAIPSVAEGTRTVVARVTTSTGEVVVSEPVEFVRDSIAPTVTIDEVDLTDENSWAEGTDMFVLTGTVTDAVSVAAVQIRIGDGVWSDASFENGVWEIAVHIPNADGQTVEVTARAVDFAGNVSTVNTSGTVDLAPSVGYQRPETTIEGCDGCSAGDQEVTFQLAGVDGDNPVAAFSCRLDDFAAVSCQSPWTIDTSSVGSHTVTVAAIDTAGLTDLSPATYTWTVVQNGPEAVLSTTPDAETDARTATFEFSASEEATFECALDDGAFTACTSPLTSNSLAYGSHLFQVRATALGVTGTAQRFSWVITNEVPVVWDSQVRVFTGSEGGTVTLNASDADPLTYRIIDAPANGTLTGEAPDLVYVANAGFTGSDSFTFVADDGQATSSVATVDVLVTTGAVPPVIVLPSGLEDGTLTVATDPGRAYATVTFEVTATDSDSLAGLSDISAKDVARILSGDPAAVDVTCDPASGSQFSIGETTVSCSATDIDDNTTIEDFVVDVVDEEPPVLSSPGNQTVTPTSADAAVEFTIPTATDNSGEAPVVACTPSSGSVLPIGDTTVSCTATDGSGNQASVSFTVTVEFDETPPVFGSVVDQTFFPDRPGVDAVSYSVPSVSDDSGEAPVVVCDPVSGSVFEIGVTTVSCTATDGSDNSSEVSFTVRVVDVAAPVFATPVAQTVYPDVPGVSPVEFVVPVASDNSGVAPLVVCDPESGDVLGLGDHRVYCTATDGSGNSRSVLFTVTVADVTVPVFDTPVEDQLLSPVRPGVDGVDFVVPSATDNSGVVDVVCTPSSGSVLEIGDTTVSCTATDGSGNQASVSFMVTVVDDTAPVFGAPVDQTVFPDAPGVDAVSYSVPSVSDDSGVPPVVVCDPVSGSVFEIGVTPVTCTATDDAGNSSEVSFTVRVVDVAAPVFEVPVAQTVFPDAPGVDPVEFDVPVATDNSGVAPVVVCDPESGDVLGLGDHRVYCWATDGSGNSRSVLFTVTVADVTVPVFEEPVEDQTVFPVRPGVDGVDFVVPSATDNSGVVDVVCDPVSGSVLEIGDTEVSCTATDGSGNQASVSFTVTVVDDTAPVFGGVDDQTVEVDRPGVDAVSYSVPSASDDSGVPPVVVCVPVSGSVLPLGDTEVSCTATDGSGNSSEVSFTVTVLDVAVPVFGPVVDQTVFPDAPGVDPVSYSVPSVSDNSGEAPSVVCDPVSGSVLPIGDTTVSCTATDDSGNLSEVSFMVTVVDDTAPVFGVVDDQTVEVDAPGVDAVEFVVPSVSDDSGVAPVVVCVPVSGSVLALGETEVSCTATDGSGNSSEVSFTVTVLDVAVPVFDTPVDQTMFPDRPGVDRVEFVVPSATDNSGVVDVVCAPASGSVLPIGVTPVTCTATDGSENSSEVSFTVTVVDDTAPVFATVLDQTVFPPLPGVGPAAYPMPSVSDDSGVVDVVCVPASGSVLPIGDTTVSCTATDDSENSSEVSFTVSVVDVAAPVFGAVPAQTVFPPLPGVSPTVFVEPSASDNSGVVSVVCDPASGDVLGLGDHRVFCVAEDGSGNSRSVWFVVTVADETGPVFAAAEDQTFFPDRPGVDGVEFVVPSVSDNSGVAPSVVCDPLSGSVFPIGDTTVTCTATDGSNNSSEVSFTVTVADVTAPVFGTVEDQTLYPELPGLDPVPFVEPSATDDSGVVVVVCVPASGSVLPLGDHPVSCTATDGSGSSRSASFTVTVADVTPPIIDAMDDLEVYPDRPGLDGVEYVEPSATDNAGPVDVVCVPASGDVFELGDSTVSCTATDGSQNTAETSFTVTVIDELPPVFGTATDQTFTPAAPGVEGTDFEVPAVSDNSGVVTVLCDPEPGSVLAVGDTDVSCTAMDESGHWAKASFTVTVIDVVPPVWESLSPMVQTLSVLRPGEDRVWYDMPSAIDGQADAAVVCVPMPGSVLPVGETVVSCTATDSSGNVQSMSMSITVAAMASELPATGSGGLPLWPAWMLVMVGWALWLVDRSRRRI